VDNIEESQVITVEQNRENMNNFSQEIPFFLFNHQIFPFQANKNNIYLTAAANISTG